MPEATFLHHLATIPNASVLELGTRRVDGQPSTLRREWLAPRATEYIASDFQAGLDVDVVADVHTLSDTFGENRFDGIIACSVLEHVQYPWIAAVEISRVLKPGGWLFVQTHQTFHLHGYPNDYWRFSEDSLRLLFGAQAGLQPQATRSDFPCYIVSEREPHLVLHPSFLNVLITARKQAHPVTGAGGRLPDVYPTPPAPSLGYGHHWLVDQLAQRSAPSVLELGSRREPGQPATTHRDWVPHAREYLGVDIQAGEDVDIVADVHHLADAVGENRFDAVIACSLLEHTAYPWQVAEQIGKVLKPGGLVFILGHQSYPLRGAPNDYWRFSEAGLATLFDTGFKIISTTSDLRCHIVSERMPGIAPEPAFLNVILIGRKR